MPVGKLPLRDKCDHMAAENNHQTHYRVVLADDNKEMRDTVKDHLGPKFKIVGAVADGRALVETVSELEPDFAVVDISMPIKNGIQAAAEIADSGSATKIIFLTVNEDLDFVRAAFDAGGIGYVIKRSMAIDLPKALAEALGGRKFVSDGFEITEED